jgi:hypothetical protein
MPTRQSAPVSTARSDPPRGLPLLNENAARIDVGNTEHWVAVPPGRDTNLRRVEPFGNLPAAEVLFDQGPIHLLDDGGLGRFDDHLRRTAVTLGQIAVPITLEGPRQELAPARLLSTTPPGAFQYLGALVLGHHALHLRVTEGVLQKDAARVQLLKLVNQQPLVRIVAGQAIRGEHDHRIDFSALSTIA